MVFSFFFFFKQIEMLRKLDSELAELVVACVSVRKTVLYLGSL